MPFAKCSDQSFGSRIALGVPFTAKVLSDTIYETVLSVCVKR
jgi:hypothetical protein